MLKRIVIQTKNAPMPVGAYSQAMSKGGLIYTSGQLPIDAESGVMVVGNIEAEVRKSLENVKNIIEAGGCSLADVMKVTVFLTDISLFKDVDRVYAAFFGDCKPARSIVGVKALPKEARVEIEAVAIV